MVREFASPVLHLEDHEDNSFLYPRSNVTLSANRHHTPYHHPQRTSLSQVDSYPYSADSPQYPLYQSLYPLRPIVDSYTLDVDNMELALDPNTCALRRYHETQTRQHAQVLQQLAQSTGATSTNPAKDVSPSSYGLAVHGTACSIPMSNIRPRRQTSHDPQYSHLPVHQYPANNNLHFRYPPKNGLYNPDVSNGRAFMAQQTIYDEAEQDNYSEYHVSTTTHVPIIASLSNTVPLHSAADVLRSGPRSNTVHSLSLPENPLRLSGRPTDAPKPLHSSATLPDLAALAASYVDTRSGQYTTLDKTDIKELESAMASEQGRNLHRDAVAVVDGYSNRNLSNGQNRKRARTPQCADLPDDGLPPAKRKKKSKMHECHVCHKQFPRPSGLKTHMNTHNNERPFPCEFAGCNRTFGVRSNAKRHLRTHGVVPVQNTGPQPYVVDFSTPLVLDQNLRASSSGSTEKPTSSEDGERGQNSAAPSTGQAGRARGRQFKLKWMPQSSASDHASKGKGKKKAVDSKISRSGTDPDFQPNYGQYEEYYEEDSDGVTDDDGDLDLGNGVDEREDEHLVGDDITNNREEIGRNIMEMKPCPSSSRSDSPRSQASSPNNSLSSSSGFDSSSASTSTASSTLPSESTACFTLPPSWSSQSINWYDIGG